MSNPVVSVIMSTYNEKINWLEEAVNSILNQTFKDFEFIIVLDNPNRKDIKSLIEEYKKKDSRIVILENEVNIGLVKSLNKALVAAKGKYIARMDADDISFINRLKEQYEFMEKNKDISFIGAKVRYIDENNKVLQDMTNVLPLNHENIKNTLVFGNSFNHPTWFYKRNILKTVVNYRSIPFAEDYDFVTRVITAGNKVANLDKTLLDYRVRSSGISKSNNYRQVRVSYIVSKMYKNRLKGNSDEEWLNLIKKLESLKAGEESFEKALDYEYTYKHSKGLKKIYYFAASMLVSPTHFKQWVYNRRYTYHVNRK